MDPRTPKVSYVLSPLDGVLSHLTDENMEARKDSLAHFGVCVCVGMGVGWLRA